MRADRDLTRGPVGRVLLRVSAPMTLGILGVLSVGLADAFFLARAGEAALAAISFVFPVIATLIALAMGLATGTNAVVSQRIGRGARGRERHRLTLHAMMLAALLSGLAAGLFHLFARDIFSLMGARGAVLDGALGYVGYWCLSFPPMVTGMALNATFRAGGRSGVAATVMVAQAAMNVALDPVFIFGLGPVPAMGTEGAGLATLVARALAFIGVAGYALRIGEIRFDCQPFRDMTASFRAIGRVGAPAALTGAMNPAGMAAVTAIVALVGDAAVAGFGAATRVQSLLVVPMLALASGLAPVVGQAWGAGMKDRARRALRIAFGFCVGIGLALAAVLSFLAPDIARVMTGGDGAAPYAALYLRVTSWAFFAYGILIAADSAMNARDRALWATGLGALRIFAFYVPLTLAGVLLAGYGGMLAATVLANGLGAWGALVACRAVGLVTLDWWLVRVPAGWLVRG